MRSRLGSAPCKFNFVVSTNTRAVKLWDPVGWAFDNLDDVLEEARRSAEVTHNHHEGIRGAQAVATAVFLAR